MQDGISDHTSRTTAPWNRGKLIGPKPPLKAKEIWSIRVRLQVAHRVRDLALFNLTLDSKLRACDLVALRVDDVALNGRVRSRATIMQRKTGRPVQFEITEQTRETVGRWLEKKDLHKGEPLFPSRINRQRSMTTRQYARLLASWLRAIGLDPLAYGTHSPAEDQSVNNLSKDRQSPGCPASARPHEDREYRAVPRHRCRRCTFNRRAG